MARKQGKEAWETEANLTRISGWAMDGLTEAQMAHNMGISYGTFNRWKKDSTKIREALKTSKEVADRLVENALFKRACGFEYQETVQERKLNPQTGQYEMVTTKIVNKVALPDNTAQIFWLKNKKPDVWRDRREIESTEAIDKLDGILNQMKDAAERAQKASE